MLANLAFLFVQPYAWGSLFRLELLCLVNMLRFFLVCSERAIQRVLAQTRQRRPSTLLFGPDNVSLDAWYTYCIATAQRSILSASSRSPFPPLGFSLDRLRLGEIPRRPRGRRRGRQQQRRGQPRRVRTVGGVPRAPFLCGRVAGGRITGEPASRRAWHRSAQLFTGASGKGRVGDRGRGIVGHRALLRASWSSFCRYYLLNASSKRCCVSWAFDQSCIHIGTWKFARAFRLWPRGQLI